MSSEPATSRHLDTLRGALGALRGFGHSLPSAGRLKATLALMDPAVSGEAFGPTRFVKATGMPDPDWVARLHAALPALREEARVTALPTEGMLAAVGMSPDLGQRLLARRTLVAAAARLEPFPTPHGVVTYDDGVWWTLDRILRDGRWGRIRVEMTEALNPPDDDEWFVMPLEALRADLRMRRLERAVVGPAWRGRDGAVRGLFAHRASSDGDVDRRLAVDRMEADFVDVDTDVHVVPFAMLGTG